MNEALKTSCQPTCAATPNAISSPALPCGVMLFGQPVSVIVALFGPDLARASLSARQAKAAGLLTSGTCGRPSTTSSSSAVLQSSLVSRLQALTSGRGSTLYKLTWKDWATPSGLSRSRLRASALRTSETGFTGWPTCTVQDSVRGAKDARPWDTGRPLGQIAALAGWPSPNAGTPQSQRGGGTDPEHRIAHGHQVTLKDSVRYLQHDQPARYTASGLMLTGSSAETASGGQLNPAHSRWLMGLPAAWDVCAPTAMPSSRRKPKPSSVPPLT